MRKIIKNTEPESLTNFKTTFPLLKYRDLVGIHSQVRVDIRSSCISDQYHLCAYCCDRITLNSSHNDHIISQKSTEGESLTLNYLNIVASCQSKNSCGHKKNNQVINITPLMDNCERDIIYLLNGKMTHKSQDAQRTISVLNLRNKGLENKRKNVIDLILFNYVDELTSLSLEEPEYLELIIEDITKPSHEGKLEAFVPIIVNVLRGFLSVVSH
jgi:uncharacterized protein (TIGR02646 family)